MMEWNRVKDKAPEMNKRYLCVVLLPDKKGGMYIKIKVLHYGIANSWDDCDNGIVTHWMELPNLPEEVF